MQQRTQGEIHRQTQRKRERERSWSVHMFTVFRSVQVSEHRKYINERLQVTGSPSAD